MPSYIGTAENPEDTPELLEEYPLVLTTGGGFMPFHHSEHFNMPNIRYLYPDPYFYINPDCAENLGIEQGDWCWIENHLGRVQLKATCSLFWIIDHFARPCWWFPERNGEAPELYGAFDSNPNNLMPHEDVGVTGYGAPYKNGICKIHRTDAPVQA